LYARWAELEQEQGWRIRTRWPEQAWRNEPVWKTGRTDRAEADICCQPWRA